MHPGFYAWWHGRQGGSCGSDHDSCHPGEHRGRHFHGGFRHAEFGGFDGGDGGFGVRRPLRFLAHKLDLSDEQVGKLATILTALKTERAQIAVDQRRRTAALADAFESNSLDTSKVEAATAAYLQSEGRLQAAVSHALADMHAVLSESQRKDFAYLLRTGVLAL